MRRSRMVLGLPAVTLGLATCLLAVPAIGKDDGAVIRGQIEFDEAWSKSWDGKTLSVPFREIEAKLRVVAPTPPIPEGFMTMTRQQQLDWQKNFMASEAGKKFMADRKKLLEESKPLDIKFEKDGKFVIYDVKPGRYGIKGIKTKQVGDLKYSFEVFGQIDVLEDVDEISLKPMRVEITPRMERGQTAPPIEVKDQSGQPGVTLDRFRGKNLFVNFWISASPVAAKDQQKVQQMYQQLKDKHDLELLSINVEPQTQPVLDYIANNKLNNGVHGFTESFEHRTLFNYGVRSYPSFWLIGKDGKILMSQYEMAAAMRAQPELATIVSNRIEGKDTPTPARPQTTSDSTGPALNFSMKSIKGEDVDLSKYMGKVVMVVNVASKCGFTPQYKELQALHEKYADQGLAILGMPCNQFRGQEPGTNQQIAQFCRENYGVEFDMFAKSDVNGENQSPLYKYLTSVDLEPLPKGPVKWNFEKFLIDKTGKPIARYGTREKPDSDRIIKKIEDALAQ